MCAVWSRKRDKQQRANVVHLLVQTDSSHCNTFFLLESVMHIHCSWRLSLSSTVWMNVVHIGDTYKPIKEQRYSECTHK